MEKIEKLGNSFKIAMEEAKNWQRIPTSEPGVFLIKAPTNGERINIMLELNPVDDYGRPIKRRGLFILQKDHMEAFKKLLNSEKVMEAVEAVETLAKAENKKALSKNQVEL